MKHHLAQISKKTGEGKHAVIIADRASWHAKSIASLFDNLTLILLPPYSPELNSIEQVWQWMRQQCLANRCFTGYEDIVEQVSKAWNTFRKDPERVKRMCWRDWCKLTS